MLLYVHILISFNSQSFTAIERERKRKNFSIINKYSYINSILYFYFINLKIS